MNREIYLKVWGINCTENHYHVLSSSEIRLDELDDLDVV